MRVGITGHQRLSDESAWKWVRAEIERVCTALPPPLTGVSSLAIGADQEFVEAVLACGGNFEAILPFGDYARTFTHPAALARYTSLLSRAARVETLEPVEDDDEASYLNAGRRVANLSDMMVAVWDGLPAKGLGGTADIVQYAAAQGVRVLHLNPIARTSLWIEPA